MEAMETMSEKRILLIIGGGIAAYKAPELVRALRKKGYAVRCLTTAAAVQFVSPLSLASVSGDKVYENLFDLTDETEMGHIQLSRDADLILVAPATADLLAKMAHGTANDLASTTLLATDKPVFVAPAMNVRMWHHPATQRNLAQLADDGIGLIGPEPGDMACGEFGMGRMSEPEAISSAIEDYFAKADRSHETTDKPLSGFRVLVNAGPTHEPIDPVRYIANRSSGKQGYAIASALAALGAETVLISGPTQISDPENMSVVRVETAVEMQAAIEQCLPVDLAVLTAAIADWRCATPSDIKIKKQAEAASPSLTLIENPDILHWLSTQVQPRPALVIGFAAETNNVTDHAKAKRQRKGCDWIIANNVSPETEIMGGDHNAIEIITADEYETWPTMSKVQVAEKLAQKLADTLTGKSL